MRAVAVVALVGCFKPTVGAGDPCESGNSWCPPPLYCSASGICVTSGDAASGSGTAFNYAFVTSTAIATGLVTPADADAFCQMKATTAQRAGAFVAWFSLPESALSRLGTPKGGWVRPDGRLFALDVSHLVGGQIAYPLRFDETGADVASVAVITQTDSGGNPIGTACTDVVVGVEIGWTDGGTQEWTAAGSQKCNLPARVYCLATDGIAPAPLPEPAGKVAFLSSTDVAGNVGIGSFDAECRTEATQAQLANPMTFVALVATTTQAALARLTSPGPWVRADGVEVIDENHRFVTPLDVSVLPSLTYADSEVWGGAPTLTIPATSGENCGNWSPAGAMGLYGQAARSFGTANFGAAMATCNLKKRIYCAEP